MYRQARRREVCCHLRAAMRETPSAHVLASLTAYCPMGEQYLKRSLWFTGHSGTAGELYAREYNTICRFLAMKITDLYEVISSQVIDDNTL